MTTWTSPEDIVPAADGQALRLHPGEGPTAAALEDPVPEVSEAGTCCPLPACG